MDILEGRQQAKPMPYLAERVGISTRSLQTIINHLIVDHKKPIGSTSKKPAGYYIVSNDEDLDEALKNLRHRAMSILHRMAALRRVSLNELLGQLRLEDE